MMKPYRLINPFELKTLTARCQKVLSDWNATYGFYPLSITMTLLPKAFSLEDKLMISSDSKPLALIDSNYLSTFNFILFGSQASCFNASSEALADLLFHPLFKVQSCSIQKEAVPDWCYEGSTSLLLNLEAQGNKISLVLNPDWVYQQLPAAKNKEKPLITQIETAIEDESVSLNVELNPISLAVNELMDLQVGDVISLEHPLNTPLRLTERQTLIAHGELGLTNHHKSILLKRTS